MYSTCGLSGLAVNKNSVWLLLLLVDVVEMAWREEEKAAETASGTVKKMQALDKKEKKK
jgi:hypothetical protein